MTQVSCPKCGRKLMNGANGSNVFTKCPQCKTEVTVSFDEEEMHVIFKPFDKNLKMKPTTK